ncbi:MAG: SDR family oxidoreductase [Treponema sp.]|jgi:NAD(P)-dependent dehydrogenase (short-subunit alcohol dehydrogenase family)|nr:SDR family oxidoreductase [Treponema sp.]
MTRFSGKTVIVTGGSSGIGEATSKAFAAEGANVAILCLPGEASGRAVGGEIAATGGKVIVIEGDIGSEESVKAMYAETIKTFGRIDIFVGNAAAFDNYKNLLEVSPEVWRRVIDVNLTGAFYCMRNLIPHMLENSGGVIVFTCSIAGHIGGHGGVAYTTSKHGLLGLIRQITFDYGGRGIRCNSVSPGSVYTPLSAPWLDTDAVKAKLAKTPYGSYGLPQDISRAILFLASDEAKFIYGTDILVDGGNLVRKW